MTSTFPPKSCQAPGCMSLALNGKAFCQYHARQRPYQPCLDCGLAGPWKDRHGVRCPPHAEAHESKRRKAYKAPAYRATPTGGVCWLCGKPGADTKDHVRPLSKGGTNDPSNLRPAHRACNSRKGAR